MSMTGREVRELYKKEQNYSNKYGAGANKMSMVAFTSMLWAYAMGCTRSQIHFLLHCITSVMAAGLKWTVLA